MVVIGIKHFNNGLCQIFLLHCLLVVAPVKGIQIKGIDRLCIPDPQCIDYIVTVADHRQVIGNGSYGLIAVLYKVVHAVSVFNPHITAEFYLYRVLRTSDLKGIAVFQPVVRNLYLIAVFNLLLEHAVFIADAAAIGRISQGRQGIEEAGCQTAQTAVSKSCIRFLILNHI